METRATTFGQQQTNGSGLPNWKLKANRLMQKIASAWYGLEPAENYAAGENFLAYFTDIIVEYLVDIDESGERTHDMARNVLYFCIHDRQETYYMRHGAKTSFILPADEAEWIMEAVCLHLKSFDLMSEEMIWIISTARVLQSLLKTYKRRTGDGLVPVAPKDYYESLPAGYLC